MAADRMKLRAWLAAGAFSALAAEESPRAQTIDRPLSTDRPDRTESPYTVPPGRFQLEMDVATYGEFEGDGVEIGDLGIASLNVKYGFTPWLDAQVVCLLHARTRTTAPAGVEETESGSGPLGLRLKVNLAGNDDGRTAVAVLPYVIAPMRGAEKLDNTLYGFLLPVTFPLAGDRALGVMAGIERLGDAETAGVASATVSTPIAGGWSGFLELFATLNGFEDGDEQAVTLDAGAVFAPKDEWALDAGAYYGLTSDAEDWRVFIGLSARR